MLSPGESALGEYCAGFSKRESIHRFFYKRVIAIARCIHHQISPVHYFPYMAVDALQITFIQRIPVLVEFDAEYSNLQRVLENRVEHFVLRTLDVDLQQI